MKQLHGIECMGDAPRAVGNCLHAGFITGAGMANGNRHLPADIRYQLQHALHFRRYGKIFHSALRRFLVTGKQSRIAFLQKMFRHGALVFL